MIPDGLLSNVTIRGRVGFALVLAERELGRVRANAAAQALARAALDAGWDWVAGSDISPGVFYAALHNDRDEGLLILEQQADGDAKTVWLLVASAVAYAGWHAYRQAGESMPDTIGETGERGIPWLTDYAL